MRALMHAHELQADALAVQALRRAGYPPHSMSRLLRFLATRQSPGAQAAAGSHPDHSLRIALARQAESAPRAHGDHASSNASPMFHTRIQ
jgi:predicted Zn-dependent protease